MAKHIAVTITKYVSDETPPGVVECELVDAHGRRWLFVDKVPIFTSEFLDRDSRYPQPGFIAGEIIAMRRDEDGREIVEIDTGGPWGLESIEGATRFEVLSEALADE
jgi:hypothetical protein